MSTVSALSAATTIGTATSASSIKPASSTSSDESLQQANNGGYINFAGRSSVVIKSSESSTLNLFTYDNPFKVPKTNVTPDTTEAPDDQSQAEASFRKSQAELEITGRLQEIDFGRDEAERNRAVNAEEKARAVRQAEERRIAEAQSENATSEKKTDPVESKKSTASVFAEHAKTPQPATPPSKARETIAKLNSAADSGGKPDLGAHVDVKV